MNWLSGGYYKCFALALRSERQDSIDGSQYGGRRLCLVGVVVFSSAGHPRERDHAPRRDPNVNQRCRKIPSSGLTMETGQTEITERALP